MALRSELAIIYNDDMYPVSATCTHCGEKMQSPDARLEFAADIILWFSVQFLEHKKRKHPSSRRSDDEEIALNLRDLSRDERRTARIKSRDRKRGPGAAK